MGKEWAVALMFSVLGLSTAAAIVLRGPVGKALAQWIASWSTPEHKAMEAQVAVAYAPGRGAGASQEVAQLREDVEELRRQLATLTELLGSADVAGLRRELVEVQERLDFTERMLTRTREAERLPPAR